MKRASRYSSLPGPEDVYPWKALTTSLKASGDYVYAYYGMAENPDAPFYVGKGKGPRVLSHWKEAISGKGTNALMDQEKEIRKILEAGKLPVVKLLAYNVEKTKRADVYSVVERVIQDAFGIQKFWKKKPGVKEERIDLNVSTLVQVRSDSARTPVMALDALIGHKGEREKLAKDELAKRAGSPVLLVGLSKTFHASYSPGQLAEMARMYWNLENKFENTSLGDLKKADNAALLAWVSINKVPTIVGAWRIQKGSFETHGDRQSVRVKAPDLALRRDFIGMGLKGTGNSYQGPQIVLPKQPNA